ncbi:cell wall hydrolase [Roseburia hominis]
MKTSRSKRFMCMVMTCVMMFYTGSSSVMAGNLEILKNAGQTENARLSEKMVVLEESARGILAAVEKMQQKMQEKKAAEEAARKAEEARAQEAQRAIQENPQAVTASTSDMNLLAALIYCEAVGEPYEGQVAVGAVVMNRVKSSSFPNSIREVIYQSGQFGPAITGKLDRVLASGKMTDSCYQAAQEALAGVSPVGGALYFGDGRNFGQLIGGHWFHS